MKLAVLLTIALLPLRADGLSDLKAALQRLKGRGPLAAQAQVQTWSREGGKKAEPKVGGTTVRLEDGPQGLKLGWTPAQLERLAAAKGKKAKEGETAALNSLDAAVALRLMRAAEDLLGELEEATLLGEQAEAWEGRAARKLTLTLSLGQDEEARKVFKEAKSVAQIWIAADGTPLAMVHQLDLKGRVMLISFEVHEKAQRRYQAHQGRLLLVKEDKEVSGSGLGQTGEGRTVTTLVPEA